MVSKKLPRIPVNPRFSPWGLIVNFEILHGGLFMGGLYEGRGLIEKVCTLLGGLFETACFCML